MATFTPPTLNIVPQVPVADTRFGPRTEQQNPQGYRLMRYTDPGPRGINVWKMNDGTYRISQAVPGLNVPTEEPYPDTDASNGSGGPVNNAISSAWYPGGVGGVGGSGPGGDIQLVSPGIAVTYYGGHSYPVTSTEAAALTAAGFGAYLS
jgi:hypothetical protein